MNTVLDALDGFREQRHDTLPVKARRFDRFRCDAIFQNVAENTVQRLWISVVSSRGFPDQEAHRLRSEAHNEGLLRFLTHVN